MAKILLEMKNITKTFPGVKALDNVNLQVEEGEIHALVGENGAGKSTLMNVLSGIYPYGTYEGNIIYNGEICKFNTIKDSEEKGIVIIHQELALIPYMTIGENMYLGNERGKSFSINWNETYGEADKYLKIVGLEESSRTLIKDIGVGKQQLVEIAKALAKHAKLLILDEPTTGLDPQTRAAIWGLIRDMQTSYGMTVFLTTHYMEEAAAADHVVILERGTIRAEGTPAELKRQYGKDLLKLWFDAPDDGIRKLRELGYAPILKADHIQLSVANSREAFHILERIKAFRDFELIKGTMDDVFLTATGYMEEKICEKSRS